VLESITAARALTRRRRVSCAVEPRAMGAAGAHALAATGARVRVLTPDDRDTSRIGAHARAVGFTRGVVTPGRIV